LKRAVPPRCNEKNDFRAQLNSRPTKDKDFLLYMEIYLVMNFRQPDVCFHRQSHAIAPVAVLASQMADAFLSMIVGHTIFIGVGKKRRACAIGTLVWKREYCITTYCNNRQNENVNQ
jgi:hypothetical protein